MDDDLVVGDITVKRGEKAFGYLKVDDSFATVTNLPVGIVNGVNPGPTISFTGCTGGSTYPGVEAAIRLWKETNPKKLNGAIISVPVVNIPMFRTRTAHINPIDKKVINVNCFPGRLDGTFSEAIAYVLFNEVILKSNYHIDFRGGDLDEIELESMKYLLTGNKKIDDELNAIAKISGQKWLRPAAISDADKSRLMGCALLQGVVSFVAMIAKGIGEFTEEDVKKDMKIARNVMKYLGMIEGKPEIYPGKQYFLTGLARTTSKHGGLWYPLVTRHSEIKQGQATGYVKDLKGDVLQEILAPIDGVVHTLKPAWVVNRGETLYTVQYKKEAWKN